MMAPLAKYFSAILLVASIRLQAEAQFQRQEETDCQIGRDFLEALKSQIIVLQRNLQNDTYDLSKSTTQFLDTYQNSISSTDGCGDHMKDIVDNLEDLTKEIKTRKQQEVEHQSRMINQQINEDTGEQYKHQLKANVTKPLLGKIEKLLQDLTSLKEKNEKLFFDFSFNQTKLHIKHGEIKDAHASFNGIKSREGTLRDLITQAYESKHNLYSVTRFVCSFESPQMQYKAMKTLYHEMNTKDHLDEKELIFLNYTLMINGDANKHNNSNWVSEVTRKSEELFVSIAKDIAQNNYARSLEMYSMDDPDFQNHYINRLIEKLLKITHFYKLMLYANFLYDKSREHDACNFLFRTRDLVQIGSNEELHVWIFSKYRLNAVGDKQTNVKYAKCVEISNKPAVAKNTLWNRYIFMMDSKRCSIHEKAGIDRTYSDFGECKGEECSDEPSLTEKWLFPIFLLDQNRKKRFEDEEIIVLAECMSRFSLADMCIATKMLDQRLHSYNLTGSFHHFRASSFLIDHMLTSKLSGIDQYYANMCKTFNNNTPTVFKRLIWRETNKCRLTNSKGEPLYCPNDRKYWYDGDWALFTWKLNSRSNDQLWKIDIYNGLAKFTNVRDDTCNICHYHLNTARGKANGNWINFRFKIHAKKDDVISIQSSINADRFLTSKSTEYYPERGDVWMQPYDEIASEWKIECLP